MLYSLPFAGSNRISSAYGSRTVNGKSEFHRGLDIVGVDDKTVQAVVGGTVESSTIITNHNDLTWQWGNYVKVHGDDGLYWFYCHMDSRAVKVGQRVERGDKLGVMGNTGYSFGAHTHLEVRNKSCSSLDPCEMLGLANAAGVTYDREAMEAAAIGVLACTEASYRWRTGAGTYADLYWDRNSVVKHCAVGVEYRVYGTAEDTAGQLWCQITPPDACVDGEAPELWVSAACGRYAEKERPEHSKPKPDEPVNERPVDWSSESNEFVVSATGADRNELRALCDRLKLPVKNA